ncbi:CKLF-like MARVEL transmembrane domain-containing protein 4 isoform X2 [Cherax quadricarinatus]|uniref:CKLF-like MARVEL transmembrane domain-containing protein 4 isoform X2 n=1 Tax=Cherax quadricarinatus TaxID=27406 RepID=UPI00387E3F79
MEAQFPASHTTTTAPQDNNDNKRIYINSGYLHTNEGRLKCAHLVICIVVFICTMASNFPRSNPANWLSFVSMGGFWTSAVLLFLFLINIVALLSIIPWLMLELGYTVIWTFFWFVCGCVAADYAVKRILEVTAAAVSLVSISPYAKNTMHAKGPKIWNSLPEHSKGPLSANQFKALLRNHLITQN